VTSSRSWAESAFFFSGRVSVIVADARSGERVTSMFAVIGQGRYSNAPRSAKAIGPMPVLIVEGSSVRPLPS
jgi:hypothetical protein